MYYFFFGVIPLPVTPGALSVSTPSLNATKILVNDGEINLLKSPGLKEISFDFLLPRQKYPWMNYTVGDDYTAAAYIPAIEQLKKSKIPFQFIVTRGLPDGTPLDFTNITCQIEDFTFEEDAESYGMDTMCQITLKEYKDYGTSTFSIVKTAVNLAVGAAATVAVAAATKNRSTSSKTIPKQYTVKKGDTLWNICKKQLGDGQKYKEIAKLNNIKNPDLIYPGQVLRLS